MNNKKDALNDELYITEIHLKEDFHNEQQVPAYKVVAPNGHTAIFRQSLSENCKDMIMWQECGCTIERFMESRVVNGCNINGVQLTQTDLRVLKYSTAGKASATVKYKLIKTGLKDMKNPIIIDYHVCTPYYPQKNINNCHEGTILDEKYAKHTQ